MDDLFGWIVGMAMGFIIGCVFIAGMMGGF
jgi:hypothetical protein